MERQERQELEGVVERVVFRNGDNGWTVLDLDCDGELHKVVGVLPLASVGETLKLRGTFMDHATFGPQFCAETCERRLPTEATAILRYLSSGAVKGVGPSTALRLVEKFGDRTLEVMEKEPRRLAEVRGISPAKAKKIAEEYSAQFGLREVMLAFSEYGLTPAEALRCYKRWGLQAVDKLRENPYLLCESGLYIPFERIDEMCRDRQWEPDDPRRVEAGLLYVLRHNLGNGHTCLPEHKLLPAASGLLGVSEALTADTLEKMVATFSVTRRELDGVPFVFLNYMYQSEQYIALRIREMAQSPRHPDPSLEQKIDRLERADGIVYEAQQRRAIRAAVEQGLLILTGGPGTGKTTTLRAVLSLLAETGADVAVAAPTGRAAKRISEVTGYEAKKLHRLLEVQWDDTERPRFARDERNPLECDTLVVDELSMVDVLLFDSLLRALRPGSRLILVGDADQLPAVGAGNVLGDLMRSGAVPVVTLTQVFRQAMESLIVTNAHRIVRGEMPQLDCKTGDFFLLPQQTAEGVRRTVCDLCVRRLPARYGTSVYGGIQVLCPGRKGELGTVELNRQLQRLLNPPSPEKPEITVGERTFRAGDKVMHTRNNYDIGWTRGNGEFGTGVFNGDIGILIEINRREETLSVQYDDRVAVYTKQDAEDLDFAYAITVHKSQGSEFDTVILPLYHIQRQLCYRHLLYTAVTRAKSLLIVVGSRETVAQMVENNRKTLRYSALCHFLSGEKETSQ